MGEYAVEITRKIKSKYKRGKVRDVWHVRWREGGKRCSE